MRQVDGVTPPAWKRERNRSWLGWLALLEYAGSGYEIGHGDWLGFAGLLLAGLVFTWLRYQENPWK